MHLDLRTYLILSIVVTFILLIIHPTKLSKTQNTIGSAILAFALGWILWPFVLVAAWKVRR
jgi:hypothetical protein